MTVENEIFRETVSRFVQQEITPNVDDWEQREQIPRELFRRMGTLGLLGIEYPVKYGGAEAGFWMTVVLACLLYTSPSPRDGLLSRMPSSA